MSLEGLRAWIGEVERKLGTRTRVFLALAVIAVGLSGAALYLAIDARESSVSENDVQELQRQLEAQIDEAGTTSGVPAEPEAVPAPESGGGAVPEAGVEPAPGSGQPGANGGGGNSSGSSNPPGGASGAGGTGAGGSATGGTSKAKIQELLEKAKEQNAEAEADAEEK
jgi:hypothetical protein